MDDTTHAKHIKQNWSSNPAGKALFAHLQGRLPLRHQYHWFLLQGKT